MKTKPVEPQNLTLQLAAIERLKHLQSMKMILETRLSKYQSGKIHIAKTGKRVQFYLRKSSSETTGSYISKSQIKTIRHYLQKSYDEKALKLVEAEIRELDKFLKHYGNYDEKIRLLYSLFPEDTRCMLNPLDIPDADYISIWQNQPYEPKKISDMQTQFITDRGEQVRSKSELNIANALTSLNIPYKYECPLELRKGLIIYPDFTVLNIRERKIYYWEHRGMMDDREYAQHSVARLKDYESCGIFPGKELIITEESLRNPLGTKEIANTINAYLM